MTSMREPKSQSENQLEQLRPEVAPPEKESAERDTPPFTNGGFARPILSKSEIDYRTLFDKSADAMLIIQGDKFVDCNDATVEMLGYKSKEELLNTHPSELSPETQPDGQSSFAKANEILATAHDKGSQRFEWDHVRQNGDVFPVEVLMTPFVFEGRNYLHIVWRDITERKRLQKLESRAARLDTAGTIAGQVAHDFNNLLGPMMAFPDFIRSGLPGNHPALGYLDLIEQTAVEMAEINQHLLTLGRRGHYIQEPLNLNVVVRSALEELKPHAESLMIETEFGADIMNIEGGSAQLHRLISNLLNNARDAMKDVGQITVKTENHYVDEDSFLYDRIPRGEYVKLTISDTGCGIPDDIVQKIFDPFFTTKRADKRRGSGLGLSVVDGVVKDHNGHIDIKTTVGLGTSFHLYFPITRESSALQASHRVLGGDETILVVDDDIVQREVSSRILQKLGYQVSTVDSGEAAVEWLREHPIDLVILDMVMPGGIDGADTYRRILSMCPNQRAIVVSGFSDSERVFEAQKLGAGDFVRKPITTQVIAKAVRAELDRETSVGQTYPNAPSSTQSN